MTTGNSPCYQLRRDAIAIRKAGVEAVRSDFAVAHQTDWDGRWLTIGEQVFDLKNAQQLIVVGAGKATAGMLGGLLSALEDSRKKLPKIAGWINVPEGSAALLGPYQNSITVCQARPQRCNEPTKRVVDRTERILSYVRSAGRNDCVIALISGGGSALLCSPIEANEPIRGFDMQESTFRVSIDRFGKQCNCGGCGRPKSS